MGFRSHTGFSYVFEMVQRFSSKQKKMALLNIYFMLSIKYGPYYMDHNGSPLYSNSQYLLRMEKTASVIKMSRTIKVEFHFFISI